tara:strand:+ start:149 stop:487 length:339 start_codon:yes stop_codon:yes gene_type:complete
MAQTIEEKRRKNREYRRKHPQVRNKEAVKKYRQENPHLFKIGDWKRMGIKLRENEDWESIYIEYKIQERCDDCNCILNDSKINTKGRRCLDHDHQTGFIRGIVCLGCNSRRG